jgi:iron complex outermembrane receptor protein
MQLLPRRSMRRQAIAPIALMATSMFSSAALAQTPAQPVLEELIVTAQKRAEDLQSVPVSVQALGTERLDQLNVQDFDDFIQFLPSAVFRQSFETTQVYMRGVASGADGNHSASQPSVGVYVDEQPVTTIQGSLNINVYDFARVEALAGPQGTLFGASSQAGTIRMITNKPVLNDQTGGLDVSVNSIDHGGIGYSVEGFANLPDTSTMSTAHVPSPRLVPPTTMPLSSRKTTMTLTRSALARLSRSIWMTTGPSHHP